MKICFAYYARKFIPKGDILQFLHLVKALDKRMHKSRTAKNTRHSMDCVLPFHFENGQHGFRFAHASFHKSKDLVKKIIALDEKVNYDFIFIRGRREALNLIREKPGLASKLLFLCIHYEQENKEMMKEIFHILENSRVMFFQSIPWAERFKNFAQKNGFSMAELEKKIKVLPPFVEPLEKREMKNIKRANPLQLIQIGVIRPYYGLPTLINAVRLIRRRYSGVYLQVVHPTLKVEEAYKKEAKKLLSAPEVIDHGELSVLETKRKALKAGIGMALIFDDTKHQSPTYTYLTRILEYMVLGIPVITTRTPGNEVLLGKKYPLFVKDEVDILRCYQKLNDPDYYREMCRYSKNRGGKFRAEKGIEDFWHTLKEEAKKV